MTETLPAIAVLGGTGSEGWGLALRWADAGYSVIIGSRSAERAQEAAAAIDVELTGRPVRAGVDRLSARGMANTEAAKACQVAVLTVPFDAQKSTVEEVRGALKGKILVDVTVPLVPPKVLRVQLPNGGSAVAAIQDMLGEEIRVVSAFQNIAAAHLKDLDHGIDCDVLVCGDNKAAREEIIKLATDAGMRAWHGGPIANSAVAEALTSVLLFINRNYGIDGSGFKITGTPSKDKA
ncbi:MAG: NADPH-dependent F420 reductase [Proteobacteria bacterium]|nr:NADPH-dependent F420 reductase [Pseudomonadota bacterium]